MQTARLAVEQGMIGRVTSCVAQNGRDYYLMGAAGALHTAKGGDMGFDVGIYYITALISILGPVTAVNGFLKYADGPRRFDQPSLARFGEEYSLASETILAGHAALCQRRDRLGAVQRRIHLPGAALW